MVRVAIFGSGGQLGVELKSVFAARGWDIAAFERGQVDITDAAQVDAALNAARPQLVLNPAAYNQVDLAEKEPLAAFQVNALAVRNLARASKQVGARLVHYSTDYVFDGLAGRAYREDDATHPLGAYGVSKLAGEIYASAYLEDPLIIRTSGVYGPGGMSTARGNFVESMLKLAARQGPLTVVNDLVVSPTYAPALASRTADLVERGVRGIVHLGGGTPISWFDWAAKIFAAAGVRPDLRPISERDYPTAARRPKYSALSNSKVAALGVAPMPDLDQALREYMETRARAVTTAGA